jgi:hypothetical protein
MGLLCVCMQEYDKYDPLHAEFWKALLKVGGATDQYH